jgi:hypothetical protein
MRVGMEPDLDAFLSDESGTMIGGEATSTAGTT